MYNQLPHLVVPVVTDPKKVILALRWVVQEMEKRYKIFAKENVKNIDSFNKRNRNKAKAEPEPELPLFGAESNSDGFAVNNGTPRYAIVVPRPACQTTSTSPWTKEQWVRSGSAPSAWG